MKIFLALFTVFLLNQNVLAVGATGTDPNLETPESKTTGTAETFITPPSGFSHPDGIAQSSADQQKVCTKCTENHPNSGINDAIWTDENARSTTSGTSGTNGKAKGEQ